MRSLLASLALSVLSSVAQAAYIGDVAPAGYLVEVTFSSPINNGVFARAFGDTAWKPLELTGNQATFTVHGQHTGLRFQLWNGNDSYYTQFDRLVGVLAADTFNNTLHLTELLTDLPNNQKQFHRLLTGPGIPPNFINKPRWEQIVPFAPSASIPEPSAGLLACLAISFLQIARRFA